LNESIKIQKENSKMMRFTVNNLVRILASEIPSMPMGGYLKDQNVTRVKNSIILEVTSNPRLVEKKIVDKKYCGKKFKITVEEV
jgi:hypothetical protein